MFCSSMKRAYLSRMGAPMACQPTQSLVSSSGSCDLAMMLEMASMPMHLAPGAGCCPAGVSGQYLPLPYMPVSCAASCVCSARSLGSLGAAGVFNCSSMIWRRSSGGSGHVVPAMALRAQFEGAGGGLLIHERRSRFGVVGDVGLGRPLGVRGVGGELEQLGIGAVDEGLGFGYRGRVPAIRTLGRRERRRSGNHQYGGQHMGAHHGRKYITWGAAETDETVIPPKRSLDGHPVCVPSLAGPVELAELQSSGL